MIDNVVHVCKQHTVRLQIIQLTYSTFVLTWKAKCTNKEACQGKLAHVDGSGKPLWYAHLYTYHNFWVKINRWEIVIPDLLLTLGSLFPPSRRLQDIMKQSWRSSPKQHRQQQQLQKGKQEEGQTFQLQRPLHCSSVATLLMHWVSSRSTSSQSTK